MNKLITVLVACVGLCFFQCAVVFNDDENDFPDVDTDYSIKTSLFFPFENNTNWWNFSESTGNQLKINVTDTISDDDIMYYRISFMENRVDTTDDWFKQLSNGIMFGTSLSGIFNQFLPSTVYSNGGSFTCGTNQVKYTFKDSLRINGIVYKKVLDLKYTVPIVHGFDEIFVAESIGIIMLKDIDGRWPVDYSLDSCSVNGMVRRF
jgi:hypothetical protein